MKCCRGNSVGLLWHLLLAPSSKDQYKKKRYKHFEFEYSRSSIVLRARFWCAGPKKRKVGQHVCVLVETSPIYLCLLSSSKQAQHNHIHATCHATCHARSSPVPPATSLKSSCLSVPLVSRVRIRGGSQHQASCLVQLVSLTFRNESRIPVTVLTSAYRYQILQHLI
jgi:hypothetical protein